MRGAAGSEAGDVHRQAQLFYTQIITIIVICLHKKYNWKLSQSLFVMFFRSGRLELSKVLIPLAFPVFQPTFFPLLNYILLLLIDTSHT